MQRKHLLLLTGAIMMLASALALAAAPVVAARLGARPVARSRIAAPTPAAKYLVLFVLDGARPDYFGLTRLPHVDALRASGAQFSNAFDGILEAETPAGHTALTTGSTPRHNGILGFSWAQNDNDFSLFNPTVIRAGVMEHIMRDSGAPTLAGLYKKRYPEAKVVALSGHKYYAADPLGGPRADAILYYAVAPNGRYAPVAIPGHTPPASVLNARGLDAPGHLSMGQEDQLTTRLALSAFKVMRPRMLLVNVPEFDWPLGHVLGGNLDRSGVMALMRRFDADLGAIEAAYARAGILKQTLFAITSDHGMLPVSHFNSADLLTGAVSRGGTKATSIAYNQSAFIWLRDPGKARAVAANLVRERIPGFGAAYFLRWHGKTAYYDVAPGVHLRADLNRTDQRLLETLLNGHEPSIVLLLKDGYSMSSSTAHWKADHGGATWQSQHIPLILSGPGIRPGEVISAPAQLDDIAPTVLTDMGVRPDGMQGHVLTEALRNSAVGDQRNRGDEVKLVVPMVQALQAENTREHPHS